MGKKLKLVISALLLVGCAILAYIYFSHHSIAVLEPKGMIAEKQRDLILLSTLLMLIVVIPVLVLTFVFAIKYRESKKNSKYTPEWGHNNIAELFLWGVPIVIIIVLATITWTSTHELSPYKPIDTDKKPMTIQVVALQWKWLFIYPEQKIATVNFVEFPKDVPIKFEITADAPMNSFWIPELGGQIYAMPAMRTELHLIANKEGDFRGCSANLSGDGFAGMQFFAKATSEEEFNHWLETVDVSGQKLDAKTYEKLLMPSSYDPISLYTLEKEDLFDAIIMKYNRNMGN